MGEVMAEATVNRREAVRRLLIGRERLLVVTGLGSPSYDVHAAGDHDNTYYLWGAMGSAASVGLGLATARPDYSVMVITGDGEMLMGLGTLATIAIRNPPNLTIAVLDNGHYGETGMQSSHTGKGVRLAEIARALDFSWAGEISDIDGVDELRARLHMREGTKFAAIKIKADNPPRALPPRDGVFIKNRFRAALGFQPI